MNSLYCFWTVFIMKCHFLREKINLKTVRNLKYRLYRQTLTGLRLEPETTKRSLIMMRIV
jgi:hypothetical protein